ncbi:hypothetical protein V499_00800 [Pseudogymnoascus sp. VKM F-103]|nr:hypothetical protein V499_00800 [Pseudogymnoascus sp. VKM F-103]
MLNLLQLRMTLAGHLPRSYLVRDGLRWAASFSTPALNSDDQGHLALRTVRTDDGVEIWGKASSDPSQSCKTGNPPRTTPQNRGKTGVTGRNKIPPASTPIEADTVITNTQLNYFERLSLPSLFGLSDTLASNQTSISSNRAKQTLGRRLCVWTKALLMQDEQVSIVCPRCYLVWPLGTVLETLFAFYLPTQYAWHTFTGKRHIASVQFSRNLTAHTLRSTESLNVPHPPSHSKTTNMSVLPKDFEWGFATASYQIEGAVDQDGRGKSIWDTFCHLEPSRTKGANGDIACDHYHRFEEDFDLLEKYGAKAYRFSISWSRIIPFGGRNDPVNVTGINFYNRLIDALLSRGITPWVTLYHWDLPQELHDRYGGWLNIEESQKDFEQYARVCYKYFGDRVKNWITFNEPWIQSIFGYAIGVNAPGRSSINSQCSEGDTSAEPWITGKAQIMSHARAVAAYNKDFRALQQGQIGITLNGDYYEPWDCNEQKDKDAAERRMEFYIGWFANPIFLHKDYPTCMREQLGHRLPKFTDSEFALLRGAECDFYGMNYYTSKFARHRDSPVSKDDFNGNVDELQEDKQGDSIGEKSGLDWLRACPHLFQKHLTRIYRLYGKPIIITENGCPCPGEDQMTREESINDSYRIWYFDTHLDAVSKSIIEGGSDIRGYFAWSLLDNLEWSDGYGPRFGVTFTDYKTLERSPKKSALMLKKMFAERQNLKAVAYSNSVGLATIRKER